MDLRELTNETTRFLRPLQAEVSLKTRRRRKARRTEIPREVPGTRGRGRQAGWQCQKH